MPPGPRAMDTRKPKNTKAVIARLFSYVEKFKGRMILALVCVIIHTVATLAGSYMLRPIINNYIIEGAGLEKLAGLGMGLVVLEGNHHRPQAIKHRRQGKAHSQRHLHADSPDGARTL